MLLCLKAYSSWLYISLIVRGGDDVIMVLFPRLSIFGVAGAAVHTTHYIMTFYSMLLVVLLSLVICSVLLIICELNAIDGDENLDTLYYLSTFIAQCVAIILVALLMFWNMYSTSGQTVLTEN